MSPLICRFCLCPGIALLLFSGSLTWASEPEKIPGFTDTEKQFYFVSRTGKQLQRSSKKSVDFIEGYYIPAPLIVEVRRIFFRSQHSEKWKRDLSSFLDEHADSLVVFTIRYASLYRSFYPQGVRRGDCIPLSQVNQWNFTEPMNARAPSSELPDTSDPGYTHSQGPGTHPFLVASKVPPSSAIAIWNLDIESHFSKPWNPYFKHRIDSLFKALRISGESLGARRIRFEFFEQPLPGSIYARVYDHYVDSICLQLARDSIRPDESERFIRAMSVIIRNRFAYSSNTLLSQGIIRNTLDCDNTSFLVYDVGKKAGIRVSIAFLPYHALAVVGGYAYETTNGEYFPKEALSQRYAHMFGMSADPDSINAKLATFELSNYLIRIGQTEKALDIVRIGLNWFPEDPYLLYTLGNIQSLQGMHLASYQSFLKAKKIVPDDPSILSHLEQERVLLKLQYRTDQLEKLTLLTP